MKQKHYISFSEIPADFKAREKLRVISFEFSGIQSFIFGSVDTKSTPEQIQTRSQYVIFATELILKKLTALLPKKSCPRVLTLSSGKLMLAVSKKVKEKELFAEADRLQRIIYTETDGRLQVYYAVAEVCVTDKYPLSKDEDASSYMRILINKNKYLCKNLIGFPFSEYRDEDFSFSAFEKRSSHGSDSDKSFFASLKLDLDNLGDFFAGIGQLDKKKQTSAALARVIEGAVESTDGIFPIFVGGDDIFVLLKSCNYPLTVSSLYKKIKDGISRTEELSLYRSIFGISAGLAVIRNDLGSVPLFYYSDLAEKQLECVKSTRTKNAVAIGERIISWEQLCALAEYTKDDMDNILDGLDKNQRLVILSNVGELKSRILRLSKSKIIRKRKEESLIESI